MKNKIILIVLILLLSSFKSGGCLKLDLIILCDISESTSGYHTFISNALISFVDKFELSKNGIRIGIVSFESNAKVQSNLTFDKSQLYNSISVINNYNLGGSTNIVDGFLSCIEEFKINGREEVKKMIIIITDGNPDDEYLAIEASKEVKDKDIMVCGILINNYNCKSYLLETLCSNNCYVKTYYENLVEELNKLDICI